MLSRGVKETQQIAGNSINSAPSKKNKFFLIFSILLHKCVINLTSFQDKTPRLLINSERKQVLTINAIYYNKAKFEKWEKIMAKKTYVLDTSLYLTDANAIYSFGNNDIIIPLKVLEEIEAQNPPGRGWGASQINYTNF